MNIKESKEQIKHAITAYFTKDTNGDYMIPVEKQRPVFLMGPPGIGKTAIMEQIASEMRVGLLSYSMTHHTRQSALGLPFIEKKIYQGKEYNVSEYTMSEIIASVYDLMDETGIKEGILFLDEINCVSETLAPIMLQFLQYKVFGRHKVPSGWIVVTAGNPPEYNHSVKDFDIATWDRLKRIDVQPDFDVWKEYAYSKNIHPAVLSYLEIEKTNFYRVESTVEGKSFVTARGWEDLSQMIRLYERHGITVNEHLISQYIQNSKVSRSFAVYYDLFNKYKSDYQVGSIVEGKSSDEIKERAKQAKFDERLTLIGLIFDVLTEKTMETMRMDATLLSLMSVLKKYKTELEKTQKKPADVLGTLIAVNQKKSESERKAGSGGREELVIAKEVISLLEDFKNKIADFSDGKEAFETIKTLFDLKVKELGKLAKETTASMYDHVFTFFEEVFQNGHEMLVFVTELTFNPHTAKYIGKYGCSKYYQYNKELLIYERKQEIERVIDHLEL